MPLVWVAVGISGRNATNVHRHGEKPRAAQDTTWTAGAALLIIGAVPVIEWIGLVWMGRDRAHSYSDASDDLALAHATQAWLVTTDAPGTRFTQEARAGPGAIREGP